MSVSLNDIINKYKKGILIPEIQRDYVMGAGGKDRDGNDKLKKLLEAVNKEFKADKDFDFSCIITHCADSKNSPLEIYDGQQRLTTLMIMFLYKLREEGQWAELSKYKDWYRFSGRECANRIFVMLTSEIPFSSDDIEISDFTSFSINNLLTELPNYKAITAKKLLNKVKFDMVSVGSRSETEQFFMDLNSGVKLNEYELWKAKLTDLICNIAKKDKDKRLAKWPYKIDNEWLDFFGVFEDIDHPAEEYEIAFIKYCLKMVKKENEEAKDNDISKKVYDIMESVTKIDLSSYTAEENFKEGILYLTWKANPPYNTYIGRDYNKPGAFWNLEFEDYNKQLFYIIKNVLLDKKRSAERENDIMLWCIITTSGWELQNEYLRLIKIILNHNVFKNDKAWYECNEYRYRYTVKDYGITKLFYCRNCVYGIPQYYGEHLICENKDKNKDKNEVNLKAAFDLNCQIYGLTSGINDVKGLMRNICKSTESENIKSIISLRLKYIDREGYKEKENSVFGIIEKVENDDDLKKYYALKKEVKDHKLHYLKEATLYWPDRNNNCICRKGYIRLKCPTDLLFEEWDERLNNIAAKTYEAAEKFDDAHYFQYVDSCIWCGETSYKLIDTITYNTITYPDGTAKFGWTEQCRAR